MPIDYAKLKSWRLPDVEHRYAVRDTILYALGLGCGSDPVDDDELRFVHEENIRVLPTMAVVQAVDQGRLRQCWQTISIRCMPTRKSLRR